MENTYEGPPVVTSLGRKVPEFFKPAMSGALLALVIAAVAMVFAIWTLPQAGGALLSLVALGVSMFMCRNVETITVYVDEEKPVPGNPIALSACRHSLLVIGGTGTAWAISGTALGVFFLTQLPLLVAGLTIVHRWAQWTSREKRKVA